MLNILVRPILSIVTNCSTNIHHLVCFHLVRVNYGDDDDDGEVRRPLLMQKTDTYVTAASSLISLSTGRSRATHAYIDRFISR